MRKNKGEVKNCWFCWSNKFKFLIVKVSYCVNIMMLFIDYFF